MNKLFSKIAALSVGLAMAVGVGVAVNSGSSKVEKVKADTANFTLSSADPVTVNGVTVAFGKGSGSTAPTWYAAGLRLYAKNTVTVSSSDALTGITFNWEKQGSKAFASVTANVGTYSHPSAAGEGVWSGSSNEVVFTLGDSGQLQLNTLSATTGKGHGELVSLAISGSMSKTSYTTADSSWNPNGFVVTGTYEDDYEADVTSGVEWSYDPSVPDEGITSVIATATIGEVSVSSSAQAVTVTVAHAGTAEDPFTVAEGIQKCIENGTTASGDWYVKGIISAITSTSEDAKNFKNATFNISDDGYNENFLIAFRIKYIGGVDYDESKFAELKVGLIAVVHGKLLNYHSDTPEFNTGSALVSLEEQGTGDVDVSFDPTTSVEIGASGTFTASSETAGAVFTWSVDDSSVLTVDENSGEFEAVGLGVARVTVTASAGGKEGSTYADITVNGADVISVAEADAIAATLPSSGSGNTTNYYVYVCGYVKEFATTKDKDNNSTGFDIFDLNEQNSVVVYTGKANYSTFINGLSLGDYLVVKANVQNYNGKYELTNPEKVSSAKSCLSFVFEFKSYTEGAEGICTDYDGETSNKAAFEAIWGTLKTSYDGLNETEQGRLASMTGCGDTLINAMGLYDYVTGKYELNNFITGRTPVAFTNRVAFGNTDLSNDNLMIIIVVISSITVLSLGVLIALKKKKHN